MAGPREGLGRALGRARGVVAAGVVSDEHPLKTAGQGIKKVTETRGVNTLSATRRDKKTIPTGI